MSAPGRLDSPCTTYNWQGALTKAERWLDTVGTAPCSGTMLDRIEYTIDPTGRRIGRRVEGGDGERYLYGDALNPIARLDAANRIEQVYVYGKHAHVPDVIIQYNPATGAEVERYAVLRDLRGSVLRVVSVDDGEVAQALEYGPWGEVLVDTNPGWQPFGFAGGEYDHITGLVRFGARDYDPTIGGWLKGDTIARARGCATKALNYLGSSASTNACPNSSVPSFA
jgi:RHS repeat-associated protein